MSFFFGYVNKNKCCVRVGVCVRERARERGDVWVCVQKANWLFYIYILY